MNISTEDRADLLRLLDDGVPIDVAQNILIGYGAAVLLDEWIEDRAAFLRTPKEEVERLQGQIAALDSQILEQLSIKREQQQLLIRYEEDTWTVRHYREVMAQIFAQLVRRMKA